jgi:hypothetical protein
VDDDNSVVAGIDDLRWLQDVVLPGAPVVVKVVDHGIALHGITRFADLSRGERPMAAAAAAALAAVACLASVVFGIVVLTTKWPPPALPGPSG